jgi:soluble cytochrome b562
VSSKTHPFFKSNKMKIELNRIKRIAEDIKADDEWVNDSHTSAEHKGIKDGLDMLIRHLEQTDNQRERWFHKADKKLIKGYWYAKITDIKF